MDAGELADHSGFQIDFAFLPKTRNSLACFGIDGDQESIATFQTRFPEDLFYHRASSRFRAAAVPSVCG